MFFVLAVVPKVNTTTVVAELFVPVPKFQDENLRQGRRCAPYEKTNNMGKAWALEVKKYTVRLDAQGSLDSRLHRHCESQHSTNRYLPRPLGHWIDAVVFVRGEYQSISSSELLDFRRPIHLSTK